MIIICKECLFSETGISLKNDYAREVCMYCGNPKLIGGNEHPDCPRYAYNMVEMFQYGPSFS